jgi:Ni2+-binding GTPase involved in maturation of urease and hydrogenase
VRPATFHPVGGFLGAGKTTTLLAAARTVLERGGTPAILTNDQGSELVDTMLTRTVTDRVAEVTEGCFCCRFDELAEAVIKLVEAGADTVLAEAVGSCTDLRATVVRPLRRQYGDRLRVAPLTAVVDPQRYRLFARAWDTGVDSDLAYLYACQLAEADVIAVNKIDTVPADLLHKMVADIQRRYPQAQVIRYCARSGDVAALLDNEPAPDGPDRDADIDYDRYAAAEAGLAWLNHAATVTSGAGFVPADWAVAALSTLSASVGTAVIGHAKVTVADPVDGTLAKASLTANGQDPVLDLPGPPRLTTARAVLNLRAQLPPEALNRACTTATAAADRACGTTSTAETGPAAFRPSYPRPTHRINGAA